MRMLATLPPLPCRYAAVPAQESAAAQPAEQAGNLQRAGSGGGGGRGQLPNLQRWKPQPHGWGGSLQQAWADVRQVMGITTFRIIILQVRKSLACAYT